MAEELKACPFCGGEPNLTHSDYVHDGLRPMPVVECKSCSAWVRAEDWNRRAMPSQGGEAVAIVCGSQVQWLPGAGKVPDRSKLYTHPADQVAEGVVVSRELLERVAKPVETQYDRDQSWIALEELRALLAKSEGEKP